MNIKERAESDARHNRTGVAPEGLTGPDKQKYENFFKDAKEKTAKK